MSDRILVTGGAGFIGSNVVRVLLDRGDPVRVFDNLSTGRRENLAAVAADIDLQEGDLRDPDAVRRAVKDVTAVIHVGALPSVARSVSDPTSCHEVNVSGTLNLLLAARDASVDRLVFASSSSVYGNTPILPKREDMTPSPLSPYALSKLAGEHYCRLFTELYGFFTFSLRYFNVFGPRQSPDSDYAAVIPRFIDLYGRGQPPEIHGDGGQTRDFTYVDDVVAANLACLAAPPEAAGQVYNVAWGDRVSIRELADTLASLMGVAIEPVHVQSRAGDVRDSQADATRAREVLGWTPSVLLAEGLQRTVDWFAEQ